MIVHVHVACVGVQQIHTGPFYVPSLTVHAMILVQTYGYLLLIATLGCCEAAVGVLAPAM